ncbi:MAG TPA: succinate dehydrogenase [Gammaproteobacteria bacterium]|jgi:hypothetical protein|nr:succinate dehydrogenase [Candidatus Hydrogenedentota bacterium]HJP35044.1 succinate dehydrogenase [Gammaproteobacteria bacterium]
MAYVGGLKQTPFGKTSRTDAWWLQSAIVFTVFTTFIVYSTWAAYQGANYYWGPYLSPFYSPLLFGDGPHALIAGQPAWWPEWLKFSPAVFILWVPVGFRMTCYYYRGAYYKAFWGDPLNCTVGEPRKSYWGENSFPLIVQNIHRYFLILALVLVFFLSLDVWHALWFPAKSGGGEEFGIGLGTIILAINVVLLSCYTLGCHSLRHLVGGFSDILSGNPTRFKAYKCVTCLNKRHMLFAWLSLLWVGFTDAYVRLCAMEIVSDWRIF